MTDPNPDEVFELPKKEGYILPCGSTNYAYLAGYYETLARHYFHKMHIERMGRLNAIKMLSDYEGWTPPKPNFKD